MIKSFDLKRILADDDYVIFHSQATINKKHRCNESKGLNIIDYWRIEDGVIAEHWDTLQAMETTMRVFNLFNDRKVANENGVY